MLKNTAPLGAAPPPHILKYCQLLDISGNYERISMKFSGISPLARRKKWAKIIPKYITPPRAAPAALTPNSKTRGISANYEPISTKFSEISVPTRQQRIGVKNGEECHPLLGLPHPPHIFNTCQLLDISDKYE